jgi:DNA polymerase-3 subunit beta
MQVIANREALSESLALASSVVASRTPKEVLRCVKLSATQDGLLLAATDLEVGLRTMVRQIEVSEPGQTVLAADKLSQIVRESADETLQIESKADRCHIRGQDSHFQVYEHAVRDFPPVAELEGSPDVELEAGVLRRLIEQTQYAAARENTRYAINGILWERKGKKLQLVATDGRRLAKALGPIKKGEGDGVSCIAPAKTMGILARLLHDPAATVGVKFLPNQLVVSSGSTTLSSVLVEGSFPPYDQVIPTDNDKKIELNTEEFYSAVRRAALLTSEQSKGIQLGFSKDGLVLASRAPEQGEATINMKVKYTEEPLSIGFNPTFLTDALRVLEADTFVLELKESNRPGLIRVGQDFSYVVMPVTLS